MITFFTVTGRRLDLGLPRPIDISIEDIACGLSKICRYNGQVELFYSVAQHACLVSELVDPPLAFPALNHDDSEAYLGDVSSKLKHAPFMDGFRNLENAWTMAIEIALGLRSLTPEERRQIKAADDLAAVFERVTMRHRREFQLADIEAALDQQWISHSTYEDMLHLAHRLPKFMTAVNHDVARAQWVIAYARHSVSWRGRLEALIP